MKTPTKTDGRVDYPASPSFFDVLLQLLSLSDLSTVPAFFHHQQQQQQQQQQP